MASKSYSDEGLEPSPPEVLSVHDLIAGYGGADIVTGASIRVQLGEIVAIIGPNGAGKSTLLKTIIGLLHQRVGSVVLEGVDISTQSTEQRVMRGLAYVPQVQNIFPSLSVKENLELMVLPSKRSEKAEILAYALAMFPSLKARLKTRAARLSGGERQMLALARGLVSDPRVLMLDEPSAALAPGLVRHVFEAIGQINARGVAVLLVEQSARLALELANRAYVFENGREAFTGKGVDLLDDPRVKQLYLGA